MFLLVGLIVTVPVWYSMKVNADLGSPEWATVIGGGVNGGAYSINVWTLVRLSDGREVRMRMQPIQEIGTEVCVRVGASRMNAVLVPNPADCPAR